MAASEASKSVYETKPYPLDWPVLGSRAILSGGKEMAQTYASNESASLKYLGRSRHNSECAESVIEEALVHVLIQASDKKISPDVKLLLIRGCLSRPQSKDVNHEVTEADSVGNLRTNLVNSNGFSP
jgi:hypothetical protein